MEKGLRKRLCDSFGACTDHNPTGFWASEGGAYSTAASSVHTRAGKWLRVIHPVWIWIWKSWKRPFGTSAFWILSRSFNVIAISLINRVLISLGIYILSEGILTISFPPNSINTMHCDAEEGWPSGVWCGRLDSPLRHADPAEIIFLDNTPYIKGFRITKKRQKRKPTLFIYIIIQLQFEK